MQPVKQNPIAPLTFEERFKKYSAPRSGPNLSDEEGDKPLPVNFSIEETNEEKQEQAKQRQSSLSGIMGEYVRIRSEVAKNKMPLDQENNIRHKVMNHSEALVSFREQDEVVSENHEREIESPSRDSE